MTKDEFTSHSTGQKHRLKSNTSRKTMNVIYLIQCKKCGHQYVGKTGQPIHCRMNSHRLDINRKKIKKKPATGHFNTQGHSVEDMVVTVIDRLWKDDHVPRKNRESK